MLALCAALLLAVFYLITNLPGGNLVILGLLIIVLLPMFYAIFYSSRSLLVQEFDGIEEAKSVIAQCDAVLRMESKHRQEEEFKRVLDKYSDSWARRCAGMHIVNNRKAEHLSKAENGLSVAIVALAITMAVYLMCEVINGVGFCAWPCAC